MGFLILGLVLLAAVFGPGVWVRRTLKRYEKPEDRYSGSGGELARHLLDELNLQAVAVEQTEVGDHYDPLEKVVRLSPAYFDGRSLTAITVAAHEVGHAIQDATGYVPLRLRTRLVKSTLWIQKVGAGALILAPILGAVTRAPGLALVSFLGGLAAIGSHTLVHLVTLPTEFDASFGRAMPLLQQQRILHSPDVPHARRILRAAAMTYVAASLMSLLNVARWLVILRR